MTNIQMIMIQAKYAIHYDCGLYEIRLLNDDVEIDCKEPELEMLLEKVSGMNIDEFYKFAMNYDIDDYVIEK